MSDGIARFDARDFDGARASFQRAFAISPEAKILLNIALAELNGGHPLDALHHFRQYVAHPSARPENVETVKRDLMPQAWQQTGHFDVHAPDGTEIRLDEQLLPERAPLHEPIDVTPGRHSVEFRNGGDRARVEQTAAAGRITDIGFHVDSLPRAPAGATPGPAAATDTSAESGQSFWTTRNVVVLSLGAGALVSLCAGVGFALQGDSDANKAVLLRAQVPGDSACLAPTGTAVQTCSDLRNANDAQSRDRNTSIGFYVGAGVLAVGTIATWLLWPSSANGKSARITAAPYWGARGGGVQLRGSF